MSLPGRARSIVAGALALALATSCGGPLGTYTGPIGDEIPGLVGPWRVTFEAFEPSTGAEAQPFALGNGATATSEGGLYVVGGTVDWVLGPSCIAVPTTGFQLFGVAGADTSLWIVFDAPIAHADVRTWAAEGTTIEIEALDIHGDPIASDTHVVGSCPIPSHRFVLSVPTQQDLIHTLRLNGTFLAIDDLRFWRKSP